ncbi:MAG: phosphoribosylanthranilate isomerase [Pseudomonadales bacterium]
MNRTRVKICGITRPEDAHVAVAAGTDAIGLVFWASSPRAVTIEKAREICARLPAFVTVVALTVDAKADFIQQLIDSLPIDLLQFHGNETPEHCEQFTKPYMKAIRMRAGLDLGNEIERFSSANSILLDAYRKGVPGGTGERFDWDLILQQYRSRIVLAGGLNPDNIAQAVKVVRPYAVDVSGGVEVSPGIKDNNKVGEFIRLVQQSTLVD